MFIFERERERDRQTDRHTQSASGGGVEKEGDTESKVGSRLPAGHTEPNAGFELTTHEIMT